MVPRWSLLGRRPSGKTPFWPSGSRTGWCGPGRASGRIDYERAMLSRDTLSRVVVFAVVVAAVSSPLAAADRDAGGAFCDRFAPVLDQPVAGLRSFAKMGAVAGLDPILLLLFFGRNRGRSCR